MNAKKILLFSMLFVAVSIQALAQQRGEGQRRARPGNEQMIAAMKERLNLSDDQVTKIKEIYKKSKEAFGKLRQENTEGTREEQREKFRELRKQQHEEINAVLTEEQQKEFKAWREERQSRRRRPQR